MKFAVESTAKTAPTPWPHPRKHLTI